MLSLLAPGQECTAIWKAAGTASVFGLRALWSEPAVTVLIAPREPEAALVGRYYDPATGQFLSVDPLVELTGQPYSYTGDDPVNATDPEGDFSLYTGTWSASTALSVADAIDGGILDSALAPDGVSQLLAAIALAGNLQGFAADLITQAEKAIAEADAYNNDNPFGCPKEGVVDVSVDFNFDWFSSAIVTSASANTRYVKR